MVGLIEFVSVAIVATPTPDKLVQSDPSHEIIVTGERVPRALRKTASSVVVITAQEIESRTADRVAQILEMIPNVQIGSGAEGPAIRGQDSTGVVRELFAFLGGTRPRTTLSIDGRAATFNEYVTGAASIWDVERVEVFRSPQTTTQGRNSIAGAIFVISKDPTFTWESRGRVSIGSFEERQASAVLSGPILGDQLALRVSGDIKLGRNSSDMADGIIGADIDRDNHGLARIKLLAQPGAFPGLRMEASFVHVESQAPQFEAVRVPFEERRSPLLERTNGVIRTNVDSVTALINYELGPALTSRTTLSYGDALVQRFGLPGLGRTRVESKDHSAETTLDWQPAFPFKAITGVHYLAMRQRQSIDITGLGIGIGGFRDRQRSVGLFGEATWRPATWIAITGGLRYQHDFQDRDGQVGPVERGITVDYRQGFDAWLPKVSVAVDLAEQVTGGLLMQRAFNPGGTTVNLATRRQDSFDPERLWNYEAFVRSSFARQRGTLAANLFYNAISEGQRPQTIEFIAPDGKPFTTTEIANAPSARSYGFELELGWRLSSRLSSRLGVGLLRTQIRRTLSFSDPLLHKDFARSPNFSATAAVDWQPIDALRLTAQLRTGSDYFSDDANTPNRRIDGSTVVNFRGAHSLGRFAIFAYARNAFNAFYLTNLATSTFGTAGDPRQVGIGVETRF